MGVEDKRKKKTGKEIESEPLVPAESCADISSSEQERKFVCLCCAQSVRSSLVVCSIFLQGSDDDDDDDY